jgi:simple sugar transport system permease protein
MTSEEAAATRAVFNYRVSILWFIAFAVGASLVLMRTRFGSWTFAVGGNKKAAREVGVPAARTKTILFMTVSVAAFIVGMLLAFRLNSVQANVGDGQEFLFIIAAVVGGNLLTGGYGSAAGGALGALIMAMSFQGIPFAGWNSDWRFLFVGVILLLAVLVNNFVRKKAEEAV